MAVVTMVFFAVLVVSGRALKGVHPTVVQIHYVFWGVVICSGLLAFENVDHTLFHYPSWGTYWLLLLMGVSNTIALYTFIFVTQHAKATTVSLFRNVSVLLGFMSDIAIFRQNFTLLQCLGAAIVLGANIAAGVYKQKEEKL